MSLSVYYCAVGAKRIAPEIGDRGGIGSSGSLQAESWEHEYGTSYSAGWIFEALDRLEIHDLAADRFREFLERYADDRIAVLFEGSDDDGVELDTFEDYAPTLSGVEYEDAWYEVSAGGEIWRASTPHRLRRFSPRELSAADVEFVLSRLTPKEIVSDSIHGTYGLLHMYEDLGELVAFLERHRGETVHISLISTSEVRDVDVPGLRERRLVKSPAKGMRHVAGLANGLLVHGAGQMALLNPSSGTWQWQSAAKSQEHVSLYTSPQRILELTHSEIIEYSVQTGERIGEFPYASPKWLDDEILVCVSSKNGLSVHVRGETRQFAKQEGLKGYMDVQRAGNRLFISSETQVLCLDLETRECVWSVEQSSLFQDKVSDAAMVWQEKRSTVPRAALKSVADGQLILAANFGAMLSLDATTGALQWGRVLEEIHKDQAMLVGPLWTLGESLWFGPSSMFGRVDWFRADRRTGVVDRHVTRKAPTTYGKYDLLPERYLVSGHNERLTVFDTQAAEFVFEYSEQGKLLPFNNSVAVVGNTVAGADGAQVYLYDLDPAAFSAPAAPPTPVAPPPSRPEDGVWTYQAVVGLLILLTIVAAVVYFIASLL